MAEPWDVDGRLGAVDAMLTLPDGRRAAFEGMGYDEDYGIQLDMLLGQVVVDDSGRLAI